MHFKLKATVLQDGLQGLQAHRRRRFNNNPRRGRSREQSPEQHLHSLLLLTNGARRARLRGRLQ